MITLPVAVMGKSYLHALQEGAVLKGSLPRGLSLGADNVIRGVATEQRTAIVVIDFLGNEFPAVLTSIKEFTLKEHEGSQAEFVRQLQDEVVRRGVWSVGVKSLTSQTLLELIGSVAAYFDAKVDKAKADCFQQTAISLEAKKAVALQKGIRLNRKYPATCWVTLNPSDVDLFIPKFTTFNASSVSLFNAEDIRIKAGVPTNALLHEGIVNVLTTKGLGTPHQTLVIAATNVSDEHVAVKVDETDFRRTMNGLWHLKNAKGFDDTTMVDGRARLAFGTSLYGGAPAKDSDVVVTFATTSGNVAFPSLVGIPVSGGGVRGKVQSQLTGGIDEKPAAAYRYLDSFGTFGSALTKTQISAVVASYPGVVDSIVSKEGGLAVFYKVVTGFNHKKFAEHLEEVVAYQPMLVKEAVGKPVDVEITVTGDFSEAAVRAAVEELFKLGGTIGRTIYDTDLIIAVKNVQGVVTLSGATTVNIESAEFAQLRKLEISHGS